MTSDLACTSCTRGVQENGAIGFQSTEILGLIMVGCTTSDLVCTSFTRGVQENGTISLVVLQTTEILFIICFAIHFHARVLKIIPKPNWPGVGCTTSDLVCTSCTLSVPENGAIGLVVLQTTEIIGLIICFAIHFPCVFTL